MKMMWRKHAYRSIDKVLKGMGTEKGRKRSREGGFTI